MKKTVKAAAPQAAPRSPELRARAALLALMMMPSNEVRLSFLTALLSKPARTASAPKKSKRRAQP